MNNSSDEGEDEFFESLDRIPSTSESSDTEEEDCLRRTVKSDPAPNGYACHCQPFYMASSSSKYEIWKAEPGSVRERRQRLLREMGLTSDRELRRDPVNVNSSQPKVSEIQPASQCFTGSSHGSGRVKHLVIDNDGLRMGRASPGDMGRSVSCDELSRRSAERPASWSIGRSRSDGANPGSSHREDGKCLASPLVPSRGMVIERLVDNPGPVLRSREANAFATSSTKPPSGKVSSAASNAKDLPQSHVSNVKPSQDIGSVQQRDNSSCSGSQADSLGGRIDTNGTSNSHSLPGFIGSNDAIEDVVCQGRKEVDEIRDGIVSHTDSSGELFCKIKNLDNGKEFVVNELGEDGMWNKLRDVETGRQLTMEEFERVLGHCPIVQELMRRESVEQAEGKEDPDLNGRNGLTTKKKGGWLKTIKFVAHTMRGHKDKRSSDERDTSSEKGGRRSSSATDDSQDILLHMPQRTKVRQYGKSCKELTALYMGQEIQAHEGSIWAMEFSLDGYYLASAGQDRAIHVWQVIESERKLDTSTEKLDENASNTYVTLSGSSELLSLHIEGLADNKKRGKASGSKKSLNGDSVVLPENIFLLSEKPVCSFHGHLDDVLDLSWSQSQFLLSSSMDKTVRLWHMSCKSCLKLFSHNDYVTCIQFNPVDDRYFISGSLDKKVRIWSIPDRQVVDWTDLHEMVTAACYTPDGQGALVGSHKGSCRLYNTSGNKLQEETQIDVQNKKKKSRGKKITGFQFAPGNPRQVLITSADSRIRVFDGVELVHKYKGFRNTNSQISASFTANGKYVICASEDSYVYVWNYDNPTNPAARHKGISRSYEHFLSRSVSAAIPWPGMKPEPLTLSSGELMHNRRYSLEPSLQGMLNAGRQIGSSAQACGGSQRYDSNLYDVSSRSLPSNSETWADIVDRNDPSVERAGIRERREAFVPETVKQNMFWTCNDRGSVVSTIGFDASGASGSTTIGFDAPGVSGCSSNSFRAGSSALCVSQRIADHPDSNHGFFSDSLSKGSATWPEEKLPHIGNQSPSKLGASEPPNNICEMGAGGSIQNQSTAAAWGLVIVTAGLGGEIRTFQNYGLPVRL